LAALEWRSEKRAEMGRAPPGEAKGYIWKL